jgi:hypothetical protein
MNKQAQRIAIAQACGWTHLRKADCLWGTAPNTDYSSLPDKWYAGCPGDTRNVPDYLNDLNAMNSAEKVLNPVRVSRGGDYPPESEGWGKYVFCLLKTCEANNVSPCHATAAIRAEAFLRALSLWVPEESEP